MKRSGMRVVPPRGENLRFTPTSLRCTAFLRRFLSNSRLFVGRDRLGDCQLQENTMFFLEEMAEEPPATWI